MTVRGGKCPYPRTYPSNRKFNEKSVNLKIKFAKPHKTAYMRACSLTLSESGYFLRQTLRVTTDPSDFRSILMKDSVIRLRNLTSLHVEVTYIGSLLYGRNSRLIRQWRGNPPVGMVMTDCSLCP